MTDILLSNARLVLPDAVIYGHLVISDGIIRDCGEGVLRHPAAIDCAGDLLLPGLVELHTDNLERHLMPRPGVWWPAYSAVLAHDAQLLSAGITTACDALAVGDAETDSVRVDMLDAAHQALATARASGLLRVDHHLHLRAELPFADLLPTLEPLLDDPSLRLLSLMDHTPGQRQFRDIERYVEYYGIDPVRLEDGVDGLLRARQALQAMHRPRNLDALLALIRTSGLRLASHDDTEIADVAEALEWGATICEFPTTLVAAQAAHKAGVCVVAGAPNLVRGGSHSGNVAAIDLARAGCLDALSSDYVPASLLQAITVLQRDAGWSLPRATHAAAAVPARALGLNDRGALSAGLRADLLRVRDNDGLNVIEVWVEGRRRLSF